MAGTPTNKKTTVKTGDTKSPVKADIIEEKEVVKEPVPKDNTTDIIAQTVAKTMEALAPYLSSAQTKQKTVKEEDSNIRTKIIKEMNRDFDHVIRANKNFMAQYANTPESEKGIVRIPRVYAQNFGATLPVGINGSFIYIPCDNRPYKVPKVIIPIIKQALDYEDEKMAYMEESNATDIREVSSIK